uniref:BESS domain-containing protein n=2 Tax=Clastoptera arizonana TaxID=38151 RepID=A0A1B6CQ69_9HEMI
MRDSFVKDLKKKAMHEASGSRTQYRKYIYHDQMQFLTGCLEKRKNSTVVSEVSIEEVMEDVSGDPIPEPSMKRPKKRHSSRNLESHLVTFLSGNNRQPSYIQNEDEDRCFLMSMLPSFKTLDDETKLKTRIEMLQTLQKSVAICNQTRMNEISSMCIIPKVELLETSDPTSSTSSNADL